MPDVEPPHGDGVEHANSPPEGGEFLQAVTKGSQSFHACGCFLMSNRHTATT